MVNTLSEVLELVKAGPYDVLDSWEKDGHYYFKLWVKYGDFGTLGAHNGAVPFIFAVATDTNDAETAVKTQLQIVANEAAFYAENGVAPSGAPLWT